jgi:hypothetical protein
MVVGAVDSQIRQVRSWVTLQGAGAETIILGDATRLGMLQPAPVNMVASRWVTALTLAAYGIGLRGSVQQAGAQGDFKRQAIAAIDERTTDTCLRVHGQVVGMSDPFKLTGTPRYADEVQAPPFHDYCRTAVVLVRNQDVDDRTTRLMQEAALNERRAREAAQSRIEDLKKQLADLGAAPDVRIRQDDTAQIKNLRNKLRRWRAKEREEIHPASATSGRR